MGLATKIMNALHGDDNPRQYQTSDVGKTPGSFPSEEVPRSYKKDNPGDTTHSGTTTEPRIEKLSGKESPDYTYGGARETSKLGREHLDRGNESLAGTNTTTTTTGNTTGIHHKTLDHDNLTNRRDEPLLDASGTHQNNLSKTGVPPYSGDSSVVRSSSREYDSTNVPYDIDESTGLTGHKHSVGATGSRGGLSNTMDTYNEDFGGDDRQSGSPTGSVGTMNLSRRPIESSDHTGRDQKINEYEAQPCSEGRRGVGKAGLVGAAGAGGAGYGASEAGKRQHHQDMADYESSPEDGVSAVRHDGHGKAEANAGTTELSMLYPYNKHTDTEPGLSNRVGTLDPENKDSGHDASLNDSAAEKVEHHGMDKHNKVSGQDTGLVDSGTVEKGGYTQGTRFDHGSKSGEISRSRTGGGGGLDDDDYAAGHAGAKVMHQCEHCGRDNDISRYFRKEAVYRIA